MSYLQIFLAVLWVKLTPLWVSSQSATSCTKSTLCLVHKDSPVAETINTLTAYPFPFFFFVGPSLCITDETREEICWEKLTPLWVSYNSPISCTKSTLCSVHKDSPVAKTINTLTAFPFPPFCGTKSLHHSLMPHSHQSLNMFKRCFVKHSLIFFFFIETI